MTSEYIEKRNGRLRQHKIDTLCPILCPHFASSLKIDISVKSLRKRGSATRFTAELLGSR